VGVEGLNTVSTSAYNSAQGVYGMKLLNNKYTGPIITLRANTDTTGTQTSDFYANLSGDLTTQYGMLGTSVTSWLSGLSANTSYAYVTKWYDQSVNTTNHATQTVTTSQPVYDVANKVINFGYTGAGGGYVTTYNSNAYLNLPNGSLPYGDSSYSVIFKHWNLNSYTNNNTGFWSGGTTVTNQLNMVLCLNTSYCNDWWSGGAATFGTLNANSVITCTYISGGGVHKGYQNNSSTSLATGVRSQTNSNNKIGYAPGNSNGYLNGQLYYFYVFNSSLLDADRLLIEAT